MLGDEISYVLEVLAIRDGQTEDQLDDRLRAEARELGLDIAEQSVQADQTEIETGIGTDGEAEGDDDAPFKAYLPEYPRRSGSIDSRTSQSTGLTSNYSDISKDHTQSHGHHRLSRTSLSFRDYDAFLARGKPNGRLSMSFSPTTTPSHSTFSLPLSQPPTPESSPKRHFRRIRGLSMLKLRAGPDGSLGEACPHCPRDAISQRRAIHKLPCGHKLCTQALRNTIKAATESKTGAVPSCCGRPISGTLVEHVMTREEQAVLLEKLEQWDEAVSIAPSMRSTRRDSIPSLTPSTTRQPDKSLQHSRGWSEAPSISLLPPKQRKDMEDVMHRTDYTLLRAGQSDQRDRFLAWVERQRQELESGHEGLREAMKMQHETATDEMLEHHASTMTEAEDKQVKAEADLREIQLQEKRDNGTALRHMEAYCAGRYGNGEPHKRVVTDQSRMELEKSRRVRDHMDAKHNNQINVLRGEQNRRIRLRAQRQEREAQDLKRQQRKEELELERSCTREVQQLEECIASKQRKIKWRWELQMAIFTKKVETEAGVRLESRLPTADWYPKDAEPLRIDTHTVTDYERKHGISHSFALRGMSQQQEHFQIGG